MSALLFGVLTNPAQANPCGKLPVTATCQTLHVGLDSAWRANDTLADGVPVIEATDPLLTSDAAAAALAQVGDTAWIEYTRKTSCNVGWFDAKASWVGELIIDDGANTKRKVESDKRVGRGGVACF
jgi:S-adenosylhomocysteine hydrolase